MASFVLVVILFGSICAADSKKMRPPVQILKEGEGETEIEGERELEGQAPALSFPSQQDGRKRKGCLGIHSTIVSNMSAAADNIASASSIPRTIHVCFKSIKELPKCVAESFQMINPDFKVQKWGDDEIAQFLKKEFSQKHSDFFNSIPAGPIKADFFRLAVLWKLGGWYVDMDVGLKQPLLQFADPNADIILSGSGADHRVNPIIFAAKPGNEVILRTLDKMLSFHGQTFDYWAWSICTNLWKSLDEEFAGKFAPSNVVALKTSPHGLKVQMLKQESDCTVGPGTTAHTLVANNQHGCQPGLTDMAPGGYIMQDPPH
eukprot:TRINITY_DN50433_c0_g1_i1.p1 TRINITY_DN50433_c0_g1~~TRINITY_DN50433_c0_g1_i1.p1  ORF type:complete len:336 (-),score=46.21 TRINITY_DN50433_c0_g1_i1:7-960(-)